jgi:hypothetical protein
MVSKRRNVGGDQIDLNESEMDTPLNRFMNLRSPNIEHDMRSTLLNTGWVSYNLSI